MDYDASAPAGVDLNANPGGVVGNKINPSNKAFTDLNPSVDAKFSRDQKKKGGNAGNRPAKFPLWRKFNLPDADNGYNTQTGEMQNSNNNNLGTNRDYRLRNNPRVAVGGIGWPISANGQRGTAANNWQLRLQLAVNTAQYGRTFQDRTHMMNFYKAPANIGNAQMKLLTVQGKRGNIVQTFPGTEYKMIPNAIHLKQGDYLHFGWSGSDTNPNNNDGQGKKGTDRSNIVALKNSNYKADPTLGTQDGTWFKEHLGSQGNNYPAFVQTPANYSPAKALSPCSTAEQVATRIAGLDQDIINALATGRQKPLEDHGNMEELDDEGTSFQLVPQQVKTEGCWSYLSTRNNNFSNRSQKGIICVDKGDYVDKHVGPTGQALQAPSGWLKIQEGVLEKIQKFQYQTSTATGAMSEVAEVQPHDMTNVLTNEKPIQLALAYNQRSLTTPRLVHKNKPGDAWTEHTSTFETDSDGRTMAFADITEGGWYKVEDTPNVGAIIAIVFAGVAFLGIAGFLCWHRFFKAKSELPPSSSIQV